MRAALVSLALIGCSNAAAPDSGAVSEAGADGDATDGQSSDGADGGGDGADGGSGGSGGVVLNELLAASEESDDWIELTNTSSDAVSLGGWALTDVNPSTDAEDPWRFPDPTVIAPGTYVIVWANNPDDPGADEADFKLSGSEGEALWLIDLDGDVADQVTFPPLEAEQVFARQPDGVGPWAVLASSTRGAPNP